MNYFITIVKSLKGKERISLLRRIKNQPLKLKLFNFVVENDGLDNGAINNFLSQGKDAGSLYTLKNRLLDDVLLVKQEVIHTDVTKVKEQVQSLLPLLMNGENEVLLREMKKLEKSAIKFELYAELGTIYYCYYLINNNKRRDKFIKLMEAANKKGEVSLEAEKLFYNRLINAQELFYYPNKKLLDEIRTDREKLSHYNSLLQNQTSRFYLLFTDTVIGLSTAHLNGQANAQAKQLQNLTKLYEYSFIKYTQPAAHKAIECLYLRYYYISQNSSQFAVLQRNLYPDVLKLYRHFIFSGSLFVFAYHGVLDYVKQGKPQAAQTFISKIIKDDAPAQGPANYIGHWYYLLALKEYYGANYAAASSLLIKARNSTIPPSSAWVLLEITLLNMVNMLLQREFLYIEHEINLLRRYFVKYKIDMAHIKAINNLFRAVRDYEKTHNTDRLRGAIKHVQEETQLMQLIQNLSAHNSYNTENKTFTNTNW